MIELKGMLLGQLNSLRAEGFPLVTGVRDREPEPGSIWKIRVDMPGFRDGRTFAVDVRGNTGGEVQFDLREPGLVVPSKHLGLSILSSRAVLEPGCTYSLEPLGAVHRLTVFVGENPTAIFNDRSVLVGSLFWLMQRLCRFRGTFVALNPMLPDEVREQALDAIATRTRGMNELYPWGVNDTPTTSPTVLERVVEMLAPLPALGVPALTSDQKMVAVPVRGPDSDRRWTMYIHPSPDCPCAVRIVAAKVLSEEQLDKANSQFVLDLTGVRLAAAGGGVAWWPEVGLHSHCDLVVAPDEPRLPEAAVLDSVIRRFVKHLFDLDLAIPREELKEAVSDMVDMELLIDDRMRKYKELLGESGIRPIELTN